jgi:tRNA pseudouridine synthase 10
VTVDVLSGVVSSARAILASGPICDSCLGGAFGRLGRGWSNEERGRALRTVLGLDGVKGGEGRCWVCHDLFADVGVWAERAREKVEGVEFSTYLFAVKPTLRWQEAEAFFAERFGLEHAEPQKHAWNRSVGKAFESLVDRGTVDFNDPDVKFTIDLADGSISVWLASLFLYGRYQKLVRGIPQTHWPCRRCRGRGCATCGGTGKQYPESVEEIVAGPFAEAARASGVVLHGAGREDIDARMLGTGRPFVLELCEPRTRSIDLEALREAANAAAAGKVALGRISWSSRGAVARVKETLATKTYRAVVEFADDVSAETLEAALRSLLGDIAQRTPRRVAHRRADLVRTRRLHAACGAVRNTREAEIEFRTDGGLYVKELVSGDEGRTEPSLAGRLGMVAQVRELDVLDVASNEFPDHHGDAMDSRSGVS